MPVLRPAMSAGLPERTSVMTTPCSALTPNCSATCGVRSLDLDAQFVEIGGSRLLPDVLASLLGQRRNCGGLAPARSRSSVICFPSRRIVNGCVLPILVISTNPCNSRGLDTALPAKSTMMSPAFSPALAAGRVGPNFGHQHALVHLHLELLGQRLGHRLDHHAQIGAMHLAVLVTSSSADPLGQVDGNGETRRPGSRRCCEEMAVLMPITSPSRFTSGPPLLPGLMAASVWMKSSRSVMPIPRPFALTMPAVTVPSSPNGSPRANTQSPTSTLLAVAEPGRRKRARALDAKDGQVGLRIGLDVDGLELPAVVQADHDLAAAGHDVVVRQDDAAGIDDHARAERPPRRVPAFRACGICGNSLKNE